MSFETDEISKATLVKVEGAPNVPNKPADKRLWSRFKRWLFPHIYKTEKLATEYAEAKVQKEKSSARKIAEEAADIAAKKDTERAKKALLDQEEVLKFNSAVDDIFGDDGLPEEAKVLKFAKLMEKNPRVIEQLDRVKEVIERLRLTRGVSIDVVGDPKELLPGVDKSG